MKTFFRWNHPHSGSVVMDIDKELVRFSCDLPFDLATNEWFSVSNHFSRSAYLALLRRLGRQPGRLAKMAQGQMAMRVIDDHLLEISVTDESACCHQECCLRIPASLGELMPPRRSSKRGLGGALV